MEILIAILRDLLSGLIWGYAAFKFAHTMPNKDEGRLTATMFSVGAIFGLIPTVIIFCILLTDKIKIKFFEKKDADIINESDMEPEELYYHKKNRAIKKTIKYFACSYTVVLVCAFIVGIFIGLLEYINQPMYQQQVEPQAPVFMEL
jgi:hypothetical protein